jgi:hypothetical protein
MFTDNSFVQRRAVRMSTKAIMLHLFWCQFPGPPTLHKMEHFVELAMRLCQLFKLGGWAYSVSAERGFHRQIGIVN